MTTRESVAVGAMVLALVYAGCELTSKAAKPRTVAANGGGMKALSTLIDAGFKGPLNPESEAGVLRTAVAPVLMDPFVDRPVLLPGDGAAGGMRSPGFSYSGLLQVGDATVAFINGHEYRAGDELATGGYVVEAISPAEVVLRCTTGEGTVTVPMEEGGF